MVEDDRTYSLKEIIEEVRKEELTVKMNEDYFKIVEETGNKEEALDEIESRREDMKIGEGVYAEFEEMNYEAKMRERFNKLKEYYKDENMADLEENCKNENGPYQIPAGFKNELKNDLRKKASKLKEINELEWGIKELENDIVKGIKKQGRIDDTLEKKMSDFFKQKEKLEREDGRTKEEIKRNKILREHNFSLINGGDEISKKINDYLGFLAITGNLRQSLYFDTKVEAEKLMLSIAQEAIQLSPGEGLELLNDLRDELISLLKRYDMEASLKGARIPETPSEDEIQSLQTEEARDKVIKQIERIIEKM